MNVSRFVLLAGFGLLAGCEVPEQTEARDIPVQDGVTRLRWRVEHAPNDYFIQMAEQFKTIVERDTDGRVLVEVIDDSGCYSERRPDLSGTAFHESKSEYADGIRERVADAEGEEDEHAYFGVNAVALRRAENLALLEAGELEISQDYAFHLATVSNPLFGVLDLPYLFDNYAHVESMIDSDVGENLLDSVAETRPYRGLSYTFSGGLLNVVHRADAPPFAGAETWAGRTFGLVSSDTRKRTLRNLGSQLGLMSRTSAWRPTLQVKRGDVDAIEVNLPDVEHWLANEIDNPRRSRGLAVTETQHTLLSTILLIREDVYQQMTPEDQAVVKAAAIETGRFERQLTIARGEAAELRLREAGFPWNEVSAAHRASVRMASQPVYDAVFAELPGSADLVEAIRGMVDGVEDTGASLAEKAE